MNIKLSFDVFVLIISFILSLVFGKILIPWLKRIKFGQPVREDGPKSHLAKTGTPTMGGIIFILAILLVGIYCSFRSPKILPILFLTVGFGVIGFLDDYLKIVKKVNEGLNPMQKMIGLIIVSSLFTIYVTYFTDVSSNIAIPFMGTTIAMSEYLFIPITMLLLLGTSNAVNLTDGLDGLASGVTLTVMVFFTLVTSLNCSEWSHIKTFSAIISGAIIGFLAYNLKPASVFMGDTGSLALGGAVSGVAVLTGMHFVLIIAGGIFVIEALSVIIQVLYFKKTKKRIFRMSPLHHHYELGGWSENKVVYVFWLASTIFCLIAYLSIMGIDWTCAI